MANLKSATKRLVKFGTKNRKLYSKNSPVRKQLASGIKAMRSRYGATKARNKWNYGKGFSEAYNGTRHY